MDYPIYSAEILVVGSGCAGLNAADTLFDFGKTDILLVTEGMNMGTSRNTGSDKQTYYKLSLASGEADSVSDLAQTLFSGGGVNGDTALVDAACSVRSFMKLVHLGVPFPTNRYGEFVGYQTDHDTKKRATSAGPLTSKFMTEALEKSVRQKKIPIKDETVIFKILTQNNAVIGAVGFDKKEKKIVLFRCPNIILATGGHAMIYENRVYPESQTGMTGMALEAGAEGANLSEWQYGIASVDFRWNLSGTYQQVMPRYVSVDESGEEHEFLPDYFAYPEDAINYVFMKGYQWPFDSAKVNGSSVIDLIVYHETVHKGRTVYMDFTREPSALANGFDALSKEAFGYLEQSDALLKTPIARLEKMNPKAIELYKSHGIDLKKDMLKISVCAQHTNGGLAVDENHETTVSGLFAAGEVAGTFGVYRPGGTALNATQTGSFRASEYIACSPTKKMVSEKVISDCAKNEIGGMFGDADWNIGETVNRFASEMSRAGAFLRNVPDMKKLKEQCEKMLKTFPMIPVNGKALAGIKLRDMLITQIAVLDAMIMTAKHVGSRGGSLVTDGTCPMNSVKQIFAMAEHQKPTGENQVIYTAYQNGTAKSRFCDVRPIPEENNRFETVWNAYMEKRNI